MHMQKLDNCDWMILDQLQRRGRLTNVELARRVGLSAPACLRRVRALEEAGIITGYRALIDETRLGFGVTVFALIGLHSQAEADLSSFRALLDGWPIVREAYMLSGEIDFLLRCVAPDLPAFQNFLMRELTAAPNVDSVRTCLSLGATKSAPPVPIEEDPTGTPTETGP